MTLAEALVQVEGWFKVHTEIGMATEYVDSNDEFVKEGPRDWHKAPSGEPYVTLMSGGIKEPGRPLTAFFSTEVRAVNWWVYAIEDYAESIAPREEWSKLHLYWRMRPTMESESYVAMNQAAILQRSGEWELQMELCTIHSRLLITKLNPDGKEDD